MAGVGLGVSEGGHHDAQIGIALRYLGLGDDVAHEASAVKRRPLEVLDRDSTRADSKGFALHLCPHRGTPQLSVNALLENNFSDTEPRCTNFCEISGVSGPRDRLGRRGQ